MVEREEKIERAPAEVLSSSLQSSTAAMSSLIDELRLKQDALLNSLENQNHSLQNNASVQQVHQTMLRTQQYYKKVLGLRKEVLELHVRAGKLKKRALEVEREATFSLTERRKKTAQEERLIARPIK